MRKLILAALCIGLIFGVSMAADIGMKIMKVTEKDPVAGRIEADGSVTIFTFEKLPDAVHWDNQDAKHTGPFTLYLTGTMCKGDRWSQIEYMPVGVKVNPYTYMFSGVKMEDGHWCRINRRVYDDNSNIGTAYPFFSKAHVKHLGGDTGYGVRKNAGVFEIDGTKVSK